MKKAIYKVFVKRLIHSLAKSIQVVYFYIKKSVRKILRMAKKYIRYSKNKETEIEILLHFCTVLKNMKPSIIEM